MLPMDLLFCLYRQAVDCLQGPYDNVSGVVKLYMPDIFCLQRWIIGSTLIQILALFYFLRKKNNFPFVLFVYAYSIPNCCNIKKKKTNLVLISLKLLFLFLHAFPLIWDIPQPPFLSPTLPYFQTDYMPLRKCTNFREVSRKYIVWRDHHIVSYLTVP